MPDCYCLDCSDPSAHTPMAAPAAAFKKMILQMHCRSTQCTISNQLAGNNLHSQLPPLTAAAVACASPPAGHSLPSEQPLCLLPLQTTATCTKTTHPEQQQRHRQQVHLQQSGCKAAGCFGCFTAAFGVDMQSLYGATVTVAVFASGPGCCRLLKHKHKH